MNLRTVAGWASPTAMDGNRGTRPPREWDTGVPLSQQVGLTVQGWSTPRSSDGEKGGPNQSFGAGGQPLPSQAADAHRAMLGWATPSARDHRSIMASGETHDRNARPLSEQVGEAIGATAGGSSTRRAAGGGLAPIFVAWLMGFPPEWLDHAPKGPVKKR